VTRRVLIVDDYEPWRQHLISLLRLTSSDWQVIGEAVDGADGVRKARALKPDLILLDIGMPRLNGFEAASGILAGNPDAVILFLSEHMEPDIVSAALACGAAGYVLKSDAASDLLPAMSAASAGRRFVSARLAPPRTPHSCVFYSTEDALLDDCAQFAGDALKADATLILLAVASHVAPLRRHIAARGVDLEAAAGDGRFWVLDVDEMLSRFMIGEQPDAGRFWAAVEPVVRDATASSPAHRVAVWGECAPTLWKRGNHDAAVRVEQLWDELVVRHGVETLCSYAAHDVDRHHPGYQRLCDAHTVVHSR